MPKKKKADKKDAPPESSPEEDELRDVVMHGLGDRVAILISQGVNVAGQDPKQLKAPAHLAAW